jgi:cardiolipin synthase
MEAGVRVFRYKRGFIHSKTMVVDDHVSFVGTANMDFRSFEMNFEVNAIVYGPDMNHQLAWEFTRDLNDAEELDPERWVTRNKYRVFIDSLARIFAPLL